MHVYPDSHPASQTVLLPEFPKIEGHSRFDVCVIGAGYTGISTSLHLAEMGCNVALVDSKRVGWGASGRNGGQLGYGMSVLQPDLIRLVGKEDARRFWGISVESVNLFHALCEKYAIECNFKSGNLACATTQLNLEHLNSHADTVNSYGERIYDQLDRDSTAYISGSLAYTGSILAHRAGHLNPLKYVLGLARAAKDSGVEIFEDSHVKNIELSAPVSVGFDSGTMTADYVVIACNGYLGNLNNSLANRILPVDNYQATTEKLDSETIKSLIKGDVCIWDTSKSVHYYRLTPDNRLVMGCSIGVPGHPPRKLERDCRGHIEYVYPDLKDVKLDYIWGGTLAGTINKLPDVGRVAPNILYAQGYSGHGVGTAPLVGQYIAQAIDSQSGEFEFMSGIKHKNIPGGRFLRLPAVLAYRFMTNTVNKLISK